MTDPKSEITMLSSILPFATTLLAAFGGGWLSHVFSIRQWEKRENIRKRDFKTAIAAEIQTILYFEQRRLWLESVEAFIKMLQSEDTRDEAIRLLALDHSDSPTRKAQSREALTRIYDTNSERIGDLEKDAFDVVKFYTEIKAFNLSSDFLQSPIAHTELGTTGVLTTLQMEYDALKANFRLGKELVDRLRA